MNILITGIHGFVGTNLIQSLKNNSLYGLDIISYPQKEVIQTYSWKDIDSTSFPLQSLPKFDTIIHLAGKAHDTKNQSIAQEYFDINTGLTQKIFDFFLESSARKFIFFSSVKAAADFVPGNILTEDIVPAPVGPYGESKIAAEKYIMSQYANMPMCQSGNNSELKTQNSKLKQVYILRPCMIHGPGNKGNLNLLYNVVNKGIPWPLGAFENKRSFTSIANLCYIISGLLEKDIESGIYNVGDDEPLSTNELIGVICNVMHKKPRIWKLNKLFMEVCAKIGARLHLPLNTERLQKLTENYVVSNEKIKKALGIDKLPVSAKEGMIRTIESFIISNP